MFRVSIFVDDKKLPHLLWALEGVALGLPEITPVRGAKATKNGKVKATTEGAEPTMAEHVLARLKKNKSKTITFAAIKEYIQQAGGGEGTVGYVVSKLQEAKILGPFRKSLGNYLILSRKG